MNAIPNNVAIIMDGNGRWAKQKNKPRNYGHKKGAENVNKIVEYAFRRGVKVISLYAFSAENWARPQEEVEGIMNLLRVYLNKYVKKLCKNNIRLTILGDTTAFPEDLQKLIALRTSETENFTERYLNIAINYGGRQEIIKAVKEMVSLGEEICEQNLEKHLYTHLTGDPDLLIRTSGELRLSNFLTYQTAYSEFYFTPVYWPDFNEEEFDKALESYAMRKRRYGGLDKDD